MLKEYSRLAPDPAGIKASELLILYQCIYIVSATRTGHHRDIIT